MLLYTYIVMGYVWLVALLVHILENKTEATAAWLKCTRNIICSNNPIDVCGLPMGEEIIKESWA